MFFLNPNFIYNLLFNFYLMNLSGIFKLSLHPRNISFIFLTLSIFHLDISGNDDNKTQFWNMPSIVLTFFVFQLEISGKHNNDFQSPNKQFISLTLEVFHLEISGKDFKDVQYLNVCLILLILLAKYCAYIFNIINIPFRNIR